MSKEDDLVVPLRVRISAAEDARILKAAGQSKLSKSEYVRWALENSNSYVLGTTLKGEPLKPVAAVKKPARPKPEPAPLQVVEEPGEFFDTTGQVIDGQYIIEQVNGQAVDQPVPDLMTAMGLKKPGDPEPALFDDEGWT